MFNIIVYFTIFCLIIYLIWLGFGSIANLFLLIDERFVSTLQEKNDTLTNKLLEPEETNQENKNQENKKLNRHLRFDFLLTLTLGIIWFTFPRLLFNFTTKELSNMSKENRYLGQLLSILVLLTSIISVKTIKKKKSLDKKMVLMTKLFCAIVILLIQFIYIHYLKRISGYNIITLVLISIWMSNSILGITKQ